MYIAGRFIKPIYLALGALVAVAVALSVAFSLRPDPAPQATGASSTATPAPGATLGGQPATENTSNDRPTSTEDESDLIRPVKAGDLTIDLPLVTGARTQDIRPKALAKNYAYVYAMHTEEWNVLLPKYRALLKDAGYTINEETAVDGGAGVTLALSGDGWTGELWLRSAPADVDDRTVLTAQLKRS